MALEHPSNAPAGTIALRVAIVALAIAAVALVWAIKAGEQADRAYFEATQSSTGLKEKPLSLGPFLK